MKSQWPMVKLRDVLNYEQPTHYIVNTTQYDDTYPIPVLTAGQTFVLGYTNETENIYHKNLPVLIFDDFTTAIKYVDFPFKVKSSAMKILSNDKSKTSIKYLFYAMGRISIDTELHKRYWISLYSNISIPLPPLSVQLQIVQKLDKIQLLIEQRKYQIEKLDLLAKSRFIEMFGDPVTNPKGWESGTIRDIASEVKYGTSSPATEGGKHIYLRMNNITYDGHLDLSNLKHIDLPDSQLAKYQAQKGDVLFNRTNSKELVGKTCVFKEDMPMVIAGYIIRIRVNERANPEYLSAILNSKHGKQTLLDMCKAIVGQANINAQELQNIDILIPPISLQNEFAAFIEQLDKSKFTIRKSLEKLETLYRALLQEYFG